MKAYTLHAVNDLRYEDISLPMLSPGWCLVKVKAAGICSSDIPRIFDKGTYHFPTIPGHEFSGIIESVAEKENNSLIGKRVSVFPLIPCKKCEYCQQAKYEMCVDYDYIGSRRDGGFAEYVAVPLWNVVELDETISFIEGAMMEPLAVALHAVNQADLATLKDVAIVGTGMIALATAQWAVAKGAKSVTVIGRSESKRSMVESMATVNYLTYNDCKDSFHTVLEAVGSNEAINMSISLARPGGIVILIGNPQNNILIQQDTYWKILRKQLFVKGTWNSSYEREMPSDWAEVHDYLKTGKLKVGNLISHIFYQDELRNALDLMHEHKEPYCKVMTIWNEV